MQTTPPYSIPLSCPDISDEDIAAVTDVLQSKTLSLGSQLETFERDMAAFTGVKHAIAVNSGTSALHLCVRALGIGQDDEVITSPFSFIASANCMLFEGAVPRFVDIEQETYCIDPDRIEAAITPKTKAILGIDIFGYLCDWPALQALAQKYDLALIEDSCEAIGSANQSGAKAGSFGDCGTFAFYPNKQITTGEGGILTTNRDDIATQAYAMRNQGRSKGDAWLQHEILGFNYRLSDINCALGISQLKRLPSFIDMRATVADWYTEELAPHSDKVIISGQQPGMLVSRFVYVIRLADTFSRQARDAIIHTLRTSGIGCGNYFPPIHLQPFYRKQFGYKEGDFPVTESVSEHTIALPFHNRLSRDDVHTVCTVLKNALYS